MIDESLKPMLPRSLWNVSFESLLELATFLELQSLQSVSEELGISQPTLSKHLNKLEKNVGFQIFEHGYKLTLTPAGRRFALYASSILEHMMKSVQECSEQDPLSKQTLRIQENDLTFAGQETFNRILNRFMTIHEGYDFSLITKNPHEVEWVLREGLMDICFCNEFGDIEQIIQAYKAAGVGLVYLSSEGVMVWAKKHHRILANEVIAASDVSHERVMTMLSTRSPHEMSLSERLFRTEAYKDLHLKRDLRTAEKRTKFFMMDPGESIFLLPESFVHIPNVYERTSMICKPIGDGTATHHMFMAYRLDDDNECVHEFVEYLVSELA